LLVLVELVLERLLGQVFEEQCELVQRLVLELQQVLGRKQYFMVLLLELVPSLEPEELLLELILEVWPQEPLLELE